MRRQLYANAAGAQERQRKKQEKAESRKQFNWVRVSDELLLGSKAELARRHSVLQSAERA